MIRFGVVGTGWITDEFIRCANLTGHFMLNAVYSRTEEKAKEFARKYAVANIFTDLEQMAQSNLIDAVYIASPNSYHCRQAVLFLTHHKHVLCEKPMASNRQELEQMISAAQNNKVLLMEALKTTFLPNFQAVKDNLHKIGKPRKFLSVKCQYSSRYDLYKQGVSTNTFNPLFSNGSLMDIGVYCIYPVVYLFGRPEAIQAGAVMLKSGIDGEGSIQLQYDDMDAVIIHSKITNSTVSSEIQGEEGTIVIDKISTPEKVEIVYKDGRTENITQNQSQDLMYYEAREFIDLIRSHRYESGINTYRLALDVMDVMDTSRRQFGLIFPADNA